MTRQAAPWLDSINNNRTGRRVVAWKVGVGRDEARCDIIRPTWQWALGVLMSLDGLSKEDLFGTKKSKPWRGTCAWRDVATLAMTWNVSLTTQGCIMTHRVGGHDGAGAWDSSHKMQQSFCRMRWMCPANSKDLTGGGGGDWGGRGETREYVAIVLDTVQSSKPKTSLSTAQVQ